MSVLPNLLPMKAATCLSLLALAPCVLQGQKPAQSASANLPLSFEREGEGPSERYVAQGQGYAIGLDKGRATIGLSGKLLSVDFAGGREAAATPEDQLPGKVNRYTSGDPHQWRTGLPTFGKVAYKDVYPGIDVVYYGNQKQLEFDFVVQPGTDPRAIRMKIGGARKLAIDGSGALVVDGNSGLKIALPAVYQETNGARKKIAGRYELRANNEVAFALDSWDRTKPLVIDPTLVYSGMIGGGTNASTGYGIALDSNGNIYLAGNTYATDFPTLSAAQGGASLSGDGFVMKINAAGTALLYSTYLGGSGYDALQAIAVDSTGAAWVSGQTQSSDFPLMNPVQSSYGGNTDAVAAKLSSTGTLQFSTYLGGNGYDNAHGVAVDSSNNAYVAGETMSPSFPTTAGALLTTPAGQENAFVVKFNSSATRVYSTLAGGASYDGAYAVAADSAGDAYITGYTYSSSFAGAPGAGLQTQNGGGEDAFVAKLNPGGTALLYFTFLGGAGTDEGAAITVDSQNNAYLAGSTTSNGLATEGAAQTAPASGYDGFIAKLNSAGSSLTYLTYLGGTRQDYITGLGVDSSGNAYVGGYTDSNVFPSVAALQPNFPGNPTSLFQTMNNGGSWNGFDAAVNGAVLDISADPVTSGIIVAASENGIFRTTNSGASWTQSLALSYVVSLARSPATTTTIYALSPNNVYSSTDNGATWQFQGTLSNGNFEGLVADTSTATTVYAYSQDTGVYVSTNGGATWSAANSGLPSTSVAAMVAASDGSLYASVPGSGIYKSANRGTSWTAVNTGLPAGASFYAHSLAVSGTTIYAGSGTLYQTTNGGTSWSATTGAVPNGAYAIGVSPSNALLVYATASGGAVYISSDGGTTWNLVSSGISNLTQITEFAFDPLNANHAFLVAPVSQVGFIAQLNPAGSAIGYATWFGAAGGNSYTNINALAANANGDVFITGYTSSDTGGAFPATTSAFDAGTFGAFVARVSAASGNCNLSLSPGSQTVTGAAQAVGFGAISGSGCAWGAVSNQSWATITRGSNTQGIDAVTVQLAANTTGASRTATITAGAAMSTIIQADSGCTYTLSTGNLNMPASGGTASVGVTAGSGCPWTVTNTYSSAVTITSGASGTGNGTINLTVAANAGFNAENFYLSIGTATLSIAQAGACTYTFNPTNASFTSSGGTGSFGVTASNASCSWFASTPNSWITLTGTPSGTGNGTVNYSVATNSGAAQSGAINVGGYSFAIAQAAFTGTATITTLTSSPNPSSFGQTITLTATVNAVAATGMVTFKDGATALGTTSVVSGTATFSTLALAGGTHLLTAVYSGDSTYASSTSAGVSQTVNPLATTTVLTSSQNPSAAGQPVTLTATVTPSSATGTVNFFDGSTTVGSATLVSGVASFTTSSLTAGQHSLTATYAGGASYQTSSSSTVTQTVTAAATTTALTSSLNPASFGQNVVFTATVTPSAAIGSVTFTDGSTLLGTASLAGGMATFSTAGLTAGTHSITASYAGNPSFNASASAALSQTVNLAATTTSLTSSLNPVPAGQGVNLRATVTPSGATGSVVFKDGSASIGSATLAQGTASVTVTLGGGTHPLTAVYSGDANDAASTSAVLTESVNLPTLSITTSSLPPGMINQSYGPVLFTATGGSGSYTWSAGSLPPGLSLSGSGSLGGTPSAAFTGGVSVTVTDTISHATASTSLSLSITAPTLTLNGPTTLGSVVTGAAVSATFTASGGVPPYTWSLSGAPGLTVDSSGHVTGAAGSPGNYTASLTVTDSQGTSTSRSLSLASFGITSGGLPPGTTTAVYSAAITAAGGTPPYSFTATGLPPGVTFSGGSFGGTPTTPGSYSISVRAADNGGLAVTAAYSVTITAGSTPLSVFSTSLTNATAGQPYTGTVSAAGGTNPYTWTLGGGALPAGMSVSSSGQVSGTPNVPGSYSFGVRVTDGSGSIAVGSIALTVLPAPLLITNAATFPSAIAGSDYPVQLLMASGGVPPYTFTISGTLPAGLALSGSQIAGAPQGAGTYNFTVKATDSATPPVSGVLGASLTVRPQSADLVLATSGLSFSITQGTSAPPSADTVGVASSVVTQTIGFSTGASVPWLTVSGGSTTPGVVSVALNSSALSLTAAGGPYSGTVTVSCNTGTCAGTSQTIAVTLNVSAPPPLLSLGASLISFASLTSNPQVQTASLPIANAGAGALQINSVTSDSKWLTVSAPPTSVGPGPGVSLTVSADPTGLATGYYRGNITVASNGGTATAVVTLFISGAATISLGPSGSQFSLPQGGLLGQNKGSFAVNASNGASVPFTVSVVGAPWLSLSNTSGTATTGVPANVGFAIDPTMASGFAVGTYYGMIQVSATGVANSPQDYVVVLNVTPAATTVIPDPEPAGLVFVSTGSATPAPQTINIYASSRTALTFQASASTDTGNWLSINVAGGSVSGNTPTGASSAASPGSVTVQVNPQSLAAGSYRGLVSFAFASSVRSVNVTLIVESPQTGHAITSNAPVPDASGPSCAGAQLVPTQTGLVDNFSVPAAWPTPLSVQLSDTCGSSVGNGQIVATFSNGDPPLPLTAVNTGNGLYSATWTPRKAATQVTVTASASAPGYPGAKVQISGQTPPNSAPVLAPNGAGDVFNPQVGAGLGPGNIIQIYGSSLAAQTSTPAVLPLPVAVNGTIVIIGGVQAPLFYVSPTQINAQIPFSLASGNQYQLLVSANGALTTPLSLQLNAGAPAILNFTSGAVIAQHLDGTLVLPTSPATPGEYIVIYSSGLGATDIPVASGAASPSNPPANVAVPPVLTLNGNSIDILFAGLTPGLVGLYQVNFQVPPNLATGNYNLQLTQSGTTSNTTLLPVAAPQ